MKYIFPILTLCALICSPARAAGPAGTLEPTNAAEAAEKKAAADKAVDEKYQQWKATLSPEQKKWEETLEANLGAFYLPLHKQDKVRGTANAWDFVSDDPKLPRVLLIGDSVSRGYTMSARTFLAGTANVHRAPENCGPTANALKKLPVWLGDGKWDVIHFNFGIHDRATPPADYEQRLQKIVTQLKATGAKLVWANTTPIPLDAAKNQTPESIDERNTIAARVMQKNGVVIDDLYGWIKPDLTKFQNPNDVHFSSPGYDRLAERVSHVIETALPNAAQTNLAIKPSGKLENDGYRWEARHEAVMTVKDKINPEIVLIGDSITHFWGGEPDGGKMGNRGLQSWRDLFGQRRVLNIGFGWDRTQNVLKRIELGELDGLNPQAIVIHIGTNNLAGTAQARNNTPAEIAEGISLIVGRAQAKCPNAQIILMAIFPRGQSLSDPKRAILADINQRLAPLGHKPRVTFLDITTNWLQPDGTISKEDMPDFLHPNEKGYAIWAEALRPVLPK